MSGFLYLFPKKEHVETPGDSRAFLSFVEQVGLDRKVFEGGVWECRTVIRGPEGLEGFVAAQVRKDVMPGKSAALRYDPDPSKQVWKRFRVNGNAFWIGYEADSGLPSPEDLVREASLASYHLPLSDGRKWLCPIAKALPRRLGLDPETGEFRKVVTDRFRGLCEAADRVYDEWRDSGKVSLPDEEAHRLAVACLQQNYFLGLYEVEVLELLSDQDRVYVIQALVDFGPEQTQEEDAKKNEGCGCGSGES